MGLKTCNSMFRLNYGNSFEHFWYFASVRENSFHYNNFYFILKNFFFILIISSREIQVKNLIFKLFKYLLECYLNANEQTKNFIFSIAFLTSLPVLYLFIDQEFLLNSFQLTMELAFQITPFRVK